MQQIRTIIAVVLSMAVFYVYYTFIDPPKAPPLQPTTQTQQVVPAEEQKKSVDVPLSSSSLPVAPAKSGSEFVLENEKVKLVLNSVGAQIRHVFLKKYPKGEEAKHEWVDLADAGTGLGGISFSKVLKDFDAEYAVVSAETNKSQVVFSALLGDLEVKKIFRSQSNSPYGFEMEVQVQNKGGQKLDLEPQFWMVRQQKLEQKGGFFSFIKGPPDMISPVGLVAGAIKQELDTKKISGFNALTGEVAWAGFGDRYFLTSFISRQTSSNILTSFLVTEDNKLYSSFTYGALGLAPGETLNRKLGFYLGPKLRTELQSFGVGLEKCVDYGWFGLIAVPLLWLLVSLEKVLGNWGLAIIALTFIVKMILHPVNKKSMESMKAMQKLQPRMKEIQQKYKGDREKLNMEMMTMFKSHKVNPMGGCLPMILQMPIYIALYKVLWNAIELYRAPFFGIYHDLSMPDPYFVGPFLLGVLFFLQQKLTPSSASMDPAQQKMMQFMPLMFTVFMVFLPAGLIMYILVNTLMSVIQQYMIHREISFWDLLTGKRPAA
ncbi:MAG: Membrane protein oxaA [uncultured bacterium]|nr:MAG: Membrane protein oxaA [uncultured bacterium]